MTSHSDVYVQVNVYLNLPTNTSLDGLTRTQSSVNGVLYLHVPQPLIQTTKYFTNTPEIKHSFVWNRNQSLGFHQISPTNLHTFPKTNWCLNRKQSAGEFYTQGLPCGLSPTNFQKCHYCKLLKNGLKYVSERPRINCNPPGFPKTCSVSAVSLFCRKIQSWSFTAYLDFKSKKKPQNTKGFTRELAKYLETNIENDDIRGVLWGPRISY